MVPNTSAFTETLAAVEASLAKDRVASADELKPEPPQSPPYKHRRGTVVTAHPAVFVS